MKRAHRRLDSATHTLKTLHLNTTELLTATYTLQLSLNAANTTTLLYYYFYYYTSSTTNTANATKLLR